MSSIERTALVPFRHHEGCSNRGNFSGALSLSESASKQAIFRAVRKLRSTLEPIDTATEVMNTHNGHSIGDDDLVLFHYRDGLDATRPRRNPRCARGVGAVA